MLNMKQRSLENGREEVNSDTVANLARQDHQMMTNAAADVENDVIAPELGALFDKINAVAE